MAKHENDEEIMPTTVLEVHYSESECDQSFETDPIDNEPISPLPITPVPNNDESITGTEPVDCRPLEAEAEESTSLPKDQDVSSQNLQEGSNDINNGEEANGIGIEIPNVHQADDQEPIIEQHTHPVNTSSIDDVGDDSSHSSNTEQIPMNLGVTQNAAQISAESVTDTEPVDCRPLEAEAEESTSLPKDQDVSSQNLQEGSNDINNGEEANGIGIEIPNVDHADDQEPIIEQHTHPVNTSSIDDVGDDSSHSSNTEQIPMELDVTQNAVEISAKSVTGTEPVDCRPLEAEAEDSTFLPKDQDGPSLISQDCSNDVNNGEEANGIGIEMPNVDHADDQEPIIDQHSDPVNTSSIDDVGDDSSHPSNTEQIPMDLDVSRNDAQISAESVTDTEPVDFRPSEAEVEESTSLPKDQHGPSQISQDGSNDIKNDEDLYIAQIPQNVESKMGKCIERKYVFIFIYEKYKIIRPW
ncbi:protein IWS1 homolog A-like [Bradysia coprophila]|uniref:protein IWS1 homolog A-like n=1 Tax=Bradysia coprophila TaxID=38358 RepID=UPI00187D8FFF|nr:protein IWS1 homolog A-like [Bradysia coprophila]